MNGLSGINQAPNVTSAEATTRIYRVGEVGRHQPLADTEAAPKITGVQDLVKGGNPAKVVTADEVASKKSQYANNLANVVTATDVATKNPITSGRSAVEKSYNLVDLYL